MNIYDIAMKPLEDRGLAAQREKIISTAYGNVLELGVGNGANLPFYNFSKVVWLTATDNEISKALVANVDNLKTRKVNVTKADAEKLPFKDGSFDVVVATLLYCSLDVNKSLTEVKRVLAANGRFLFIEHIKPRGKAGDVANAINPLWRCIANGCNLNRDFLDVLSKHFTVKETNYFFKDIFVSGIAVNKVEEGQI